MVVVENPSELGDCPGERLLPDHGVIPDLLEQLFAGKDLSGSGSQVCEDIHDPGLDLARVALPADAVQPRFDQPLTQPEPFAMQGVLRTVGLHHHAGTGPEW